MSPLRTLLVGTGVIALLALYIRFRVLSLERDYPPLPPDSCTTLELRTPKAPGLQIGDVDVYAARVPVSALLRSSSVSEGGPAALEDAWARAFFQTPTIQLEAKCAGLGVRGEMGETGFRPGQHIMGNVMHVLRPPARGTPLLTEWNMLPSAVRFFERIAAWGYPWRLMEGGRQEWSIGPVSRLPGEAEEMVEIRYAAAQDHRIVEGEKVPGKTVPPWAARAHRAYARYLLDEAEYPIYNSSLILLVLVPILFGP